jgi:hypothetical protein
MNTKMTREFNGNYKNHNNNEKPVYLTFAASKMSNAVKPNTIVEFTDFRGKKHKVAVRNNTEMKKAMAFFAILKREATNINNIIASFPMSYGRIEKKFIAECKRDLKALGLSGKAVELVLA